MRALAFVIVAISLSGFVFCGGGELCSEELKSEVRSPSDRYVAVLFERDCGATSGFVAHINLRESSDKFQADSKGTIKTGEVFVFDGRPNINITWKDDTNLLIECPECQSKDIYLKELYWSGIKISYKTGN